MRPKMHFLINAVFGILALLLSPVLCAQAWQPLGPAPHLFGQSENIPDGPGSGAIHGVAAHPTDADVLYIAAVNGGIWTTSNASAASVEWSQQLADAASFSMADIAFDVTDISQQTLVAGSGRFSSFGRRGGARAGIYRTTDGGNTWTPLAASMQGLNIAKVAARGSVLLASVDTADSFTCNNIGVYRSTDAGASFSRVTNGLPSGASVSLAEDPANDAVFYASVYTFNSCAPLAESGIYKSSDTGASWSKVSNAAMDALTNPNGNHFEIAVGNSNNVFVGIVVGGRLAGVFRSANGGGNWTQLDLPGTDESGFVGIHPGGQGFLHMSMVADPVDPNIVYVGGDRQTRTNQDTGGFPNSIGAQNFSGRLFRGDASEPAGSQWAPLTHVGTASNTSPHADSRDMVFLADGSLVEADDGGIFRRTSPLLTTGDWQSLNGNLQITEQHSTAFDRLSQIAFSGNQDNGSTIQQVPGGPVWETFIQGDGGDAVVDDQSSTTVSTRFLSFQFLSFFLRATYDQNNVFQNFTQANLLVVGGGDPLLTQFTTPVTINAVNGQRLVIGGANAVYESVDQGDTIVQLSPNFRALSGGLDGIAFGAQGNADLLFVIARDPGNGVAGDLYRRIGAGNDLTLVRSGAATGVSLDLANSQNVFLIDAGEVFSSNDTGTSFTNVTGNLSGFSFGRLNAVEHLPLAAGDALAVGADAGVYLALASDGFTSWQLLGSGLPNAPVFELRYDDTNNQLIAGTLGRGTFRLDLNAVFGDLIFADSFDNP